MAAWSASGVPPQAYCAPALSNGNQAGCVHLSKERNDSPGTGSVPVSGIMRCRPYCSRCDKPSPGGEPPLAICAAAPGNRAKADCIHSGKERNGCGGSPPAAAPADYLQVISASCRNNTPPKLQKSPGERSGVHKTVNSHRSLNCGGCSCILSPLCDSMEPNRPTNRYLGSKLI